MKSFLDKAAAGGTNFRKAVMTRIPIPSVFLLLVASALLAVPAAVQEEAAGVTLTISPATIVVGTELTQDFTAVINGTNRRGVKWSVCDANGLNCILGGDSTVGTIAEVGRDADNNSIARYTAPGALPAASFCAPVDNVCGIKIKAKMKARRFRKKKAFASISMGVPPLLVWATFFPFSSTGVNVPRFTGAVLDSDNNLIAAGLVCQGPRGCTGSNPIRAGVLSADEFGGQRWFSISDQPSSAHSAVLGPELNSVYVVGDVGEWPDTTPLLFAIDNTGNKQFEHVCSNMPGGVFVSATRDETTIYMAAYTRSGLAVVTSDLAGNLDCDNSKAIGDFGRLFWVSPFNGGLVLAGDRDMSNECFTAGLSAIIQSIDSANQLSWRFDFDSVAAPAATYPVSSAAATIADEDGQKVLYVALTWFNGCHSTPNDGSRYLTAKLNASGQLVWWNLWNGDNSPTSCEAYPYAALADPRGGVIVVGQGTPDCQSGWDCAVASYASDGSLRWTMKPSFNGNQNNSCTAATLSSDGTFLYVAGHTSPTAFDPWDSFVAKYALPK